MKNTAGKSARGRGANPSVPANPGNCALSILRVMASPFANTNLLLWVPRKESAGMIIAQMASVAKYHGDDEVD